MKSPPFPLDAVDTHPAIATTDVSVFGAALRILKAYWQSGCDQLPENDAALCYHAGCSRQRWYYIKNDVKRAINEVIGILPSIYLERCKVAVSNQAKARKAAAISVAKRRRKGQPQAGGNSLLFDKDVRHAPVAAVPPLARSFHQGHFDDVARSSAIANAAKTKKGGGVWFTDK